jgi:hypothetical protein
MNEAEVKKCPVMRADLNAQTLPARMKDLPLDARGYPIPWFVDYLEDGTPEFRAMDRVKFRRAIREKLCWVCGGKLGVNITFVAGPMCGINRTSSEPPNHRDCALWSAQNCPFLSNPRMVRREDEVMRQAWEENVPGFGLKRNPGVVMLWHTRNYEVFKVENGVLIQMGEPESVAWLACGRPATRAEVMQSIESGLPHLEALARQEKGGIEAMAASLKRFEKWLPYDET